MAQPASAQREIVQATVSGHCTRCGYDLAGLDRAGVCPECAYSVAQSLRTPDLLRTLDLNWLRSVVLGLRLLVIAGGLMLVTALAGVMSVLGVIWLEQFGRNPPMWATSSLGVAALAAIGSTVALHSAACVYLSAPGLAGLAVPPPGRRLVLLAGSAFPPLGLWVVASDVVSVWPRWAVWVQAATVEAVLIAYLFGLVKLLRWLEERTPGWSALRAQRYRETLSNIRTLAGLIVIFGWIVPLASSRLSPTGQGAVLSGCIALAIMQALFVRVRRLAAAELAVGSEGAHTGPA